RGRAPDHTGDTGAVVLEVEIDVAVAVIAHFAELAADANIAVSVLDGALERRRQFRDRQFRQIEPRLVPRALTAGRHCRASGIRVCRTAGRTARNWSCRPPRA